ncbi:MAG TPA: terminase family protein [Bacteroidales bacterium]|nr:terminase family protein [Bacteroidales bacterium]
MPAIDYSKFGFMPYQVAWLEDESQIKLYEKSRRIGLTFVQAFEDVRDAGILGLYNVWFSSNNETNAREYIDYCKKYAKALNAVFEMSEAKLIDDNEALTFVLNFKNGKKITGLSSSPNQLHGKGGKIVLDEFARRDNEMEVWEAASPAALVWGFPIRIISTHRGKGSVFYSFIKRLERGELSWKHYKTTFVDAVRQGLADKSLRKKCTLQEQDAYIEQIRKSVGDESVWRQQFMCEPMDENETFLHYTMLEKAASAELMPFSQLWECKALFGGLDIGRFKDLSVLWLIEEVNPHFYITRHIYVIQGTDFVQQQAKISAFLDELPNLRRLCIDRTGMGIGITDHLQAIYGQSRIEGVNFSGVVKESMAFRMKKCLEDLSFLIPADRVIIDDFQLVQQTVTVSGNIRLQADRQNGSHADYFWGAALALEAASSEPYIAPAVHIANMTNRRTARLDSMLQGFTRE